MATADETHDFTEQELQVICAHFRGCYLGVPNKEVAEWLGVDEGTVVGCLAGISDKAHISKLEFREFARSALNAELRRRRLSMGDSGAAMEG
jgi:hypothetical protein